MTKKDLIRTISEQVGLTQIQIKQIVQHILDSIVSTVATEGRVELRNFGVFEVKKHKARKARNPRTGGTVMVPEKCYVVFKPGVVMEERVAEECRSQESPE